MLEQNLMPSQISGTYVLKLAWEALCFIPTSS